MTSSQPRVLWGHQIIGHEWRGDSIAAAIDAMSSWFNKYADKYTYVVNMTTEYNDEWANEPWAVIAWIDGASIPLDPAN